MRTPLVVAVRELRFVIESRNTDYIYVHFFLFFNDLGRRTCGGNDEHTQEMNTRMHTHSSNIRGGPIVHCTLNIKERTTYDTAKGHSTMHSAHAEDCHHRVRAF